MSTRYNHAFTIAFSLTSSDPSGCDIDAASLRIAILTRLEHLTDDELIEAIGAPFDTFEMEELESKVRS